MVRSITGRCQRLSEYSDGVEFVQGHIGIREVDQSKPWMDLEGLVVVYRLRIEGPVCEGDVMGEDRVYIPEERNTEDHVTSARRR